MAAEQQSATKVLADLGNGWLQCADNQGIFYYNSVTQESADAPPPALSAAVLQQQAAPQYAAPQPQYVQPQAQAAAVKMTVGDWQICEDAQGEFYFHTPTGQSYDQIPQDLAKMYRAQQQPQQQQQQQQQYQQQYQQQPQQKYAVAPSVQYAQPMQQAAVSQAAQPMQARVKMTVGQWQICEDAQGLFYRNVTTGQSFDQVPPELAQYQFAQQQQAPAVAAPQSYAGYAQAQPQQVYAQQPHAQQAYQAQPVY